MIIRKGFSLTELIVSVTIFVTVVTLAIGGIASISKTKMLISSMKESQQKVRLLTEMLSRYGKEAVYVEVKNSGERIDYIFEDGSIKTAKIFKLSTPTGTHPSSNSLLYHSCNSTAVAPATDTLLPLYNDYIDDPIGHSSSSVTFERDCSTEQLLSSRGGFDFQVRKVDPSPYSTPFFEKGNTIPSTINLNMELYNLTATNKFFNDAIEIKKTILLENLK